MILADIASTHSPMQGLATKPEVSNYLCTFGILLSLHYSMVIYEDMLFSGSVKTRKGTTCRHLLHLYDPLTYRRNITNLNYIP